MLPWAQLARALDCFCLQDMVAAEKQNEQNRKGNLIGRSPQGDFFFFTLETGEDIEMKYFRLKKRLPYIFSSFLEQRVF